MDKLKWLAENLDDWYKGENWVIVVDGEEVHWHPAHMTGFTKAQWKAKRKELQH